MPDSKLDDWKKRWLEAAETSIEESIAFASTEIPQQKPDETDDAYLNRMKRLSEAKKKFLDNSKGLIKLIEEDNVKQQDATEGDNSKKKSAEGSSGDEGGGDTGIPTPESQAR